MPVLKIWPSGASVSFAGNNPAPAKRATITGWSSGAARRMLAWLWSINPDGLPPIGFAVTLTMGGTPSQSSDWLRARKALVRELKTLGATQGHWLTEWTAKGRPHLHLCVFATDSEQAYKLDQRILLAWLAICDREGWEANKKGQHIVPVHDMTGWLKYVGKHAARGVKHYQRETPPEGWVTTGRLWGSWGDWPITLPVEVDLTPRQAEMYTALLVEWQANRMLTEGVPRDIVDLYVESHTPQLGVAPRGVSGWIPDDVALDLLSTVTAVEGAAGRYSWES